MKNRAFTYLGISLTLMSCSDAQRTQMQSPDEKPKKPVEKNLKRSRSQWRNQLETLSKTPTPTKLKMGAMCYDMAGFWNESYTCEHCKNKTIYVDLINPTKKSSSARRASVSGEISELRKMVKKLRDLGLQVELDETFLCNHCYTEKHGSIDNIEKDGLYWEITNDNKTVRTKFQHFDFNILRDFLKQKDKVTNDQERETPLKNYIPRLKTLLLGETEVKK